MRRRENTISVVEAAYTPTTSEAAWLEQIVSAAAPLISDGLGALACVYTGARGPLKGGAFATANLAVPPECFFGTLERLDPEFVDRTWRALSFGLCSETVPLARIPEAKPLCDAGVGDVLNINAYDPSGIGVWLGAPLRKQRKRAPNEGPTWTRVAAHIGSAFRLRRKRVAASPDAATAVLDTRGRIAHAESGATADRLRDKLRDAVERMERARGRMRRTDPDGAVELWRTLVDAELTLLDHFERGGKRYVIAVANPPASAAARALASLAPRERQVVAAAAAGRTNKLIAYELGIADSTVRVLLTRAARRLGASSRQELIAIVRAHAAT
ncbi:MAG TPA: helix-turn-helix transcriptional regulator [Polyangiaceae bacterium]|jgi:DNA-binding CsgD family transcriptional regulator